jgi:hypothetical protein
MIQLKFHQFFASNYIRHNATHCVPQIWEILDSEPGKAPTSLWKITITVVMTAVESELTNVAPGFKISVRIVKPTFVAE